MNPFLDITLRSLAVYFFMILGLKLFGKNQLSQLNAGDIILLLLISNAVQNAMVGQNTSLQGGLLAALVLFLANFGLKKLMFKNPKIKDFVESEPVILIKDGAIDEIALKKSEITFDELEETVREHGVEKSDDVKLAVLEVDGNISVISFDTNKQTHFTRHKKRKISEENFKFMSYELRDMQPEDGVAVLKIFEEGIAGGNATFDKEIPTWEYWDKNHFKVCRFVAEDENNNVVAWAALKPISNRDCFSGVAEVSIYITNSAQGKGLGKVLLQKLIIESEEKGFWMLQSGIFPENIASIKIHEKLGFRTVGYREKIGQMNGVWRDIILMERRSKTV